MSERFDVTLAFTPPLDVPALLDHFARRAVPGVEHVGDGGYTRSLRLPGGPGLVSLRFAGPADPVDATFTLTDPADRDGAVALTRALLDLDSDPRAVGAALGADALLGPAVARSPGRRVPGAVEATELAVRAILGQQISLAGAAHAAGRLVDAYGEPLADPDGAVTHLFPGAAALAGADPGELRMPRARARSLHAVATALAARDLGLVRGGDREAARARLLSLPGVGPWTADYVLMRVLGDHDVFLATDLGVRRALQRAGLPDDPASAAALAQRWRPYRSYAMQYLWGLDAAPRHPAPPTRSGLGD